MNYLLQCFWILLFSCLGECLHVLIPLPIPAAIYGLILLFLALMFKLVKLEQIRQTGSFLVNIMAVMFVSPTVGILECWDVVRDHLISICVIILVSTAATFFVSGKVTQWMIRRRKYND